MPEKRTEKKAPSRKLPQADALEAAAPKAADGNIPAPSAALPEKGQPAPPVGASLLEQRITQKLPEGSELKVRHASEASSDKPVQWMLTGSKVLVVDVAGAGGEPPSRLLVEGVPLPGKNAPEYVILNLTGRIDKLEAACLKDEQDFIDQVVGRWKDNLIIVIPVCRLRSNDIRVTRGLAWEATVEDLAFEFGANPILARLQNVAHIVVTFGIEAAYWRSANPKKRPVAGLGAGGVARLVFDAKQAEGELKAKEGEDTIYGDASCMVAAIVRELVQSGPERLDAAMMEGLNAARVLRNESFDPGTFISVEVPAAPGGYRDRGQWSMLDQWHYHASQTDQPRPHFEIAHAVAVLGSSALERFPVAKFGNLSTVDRQEIESLRTLRSLIEEYVKYDKGKKPLCLGVFGPPGAGKSFGVNEIAMSVLKIKEEEILTFNLSQFSGPTDLTLALKDVVKHGKCCEVPFIFWDEFDSADYSWLQYLLAPMQDGKFRDGDYVPPLGKCIFVFAGATSPTYQEFGPLNPMVSSAAIAPDDRKEAELRWREFVLKKGPDFKSRLSGYLNVLGPNPRQIVKVVRGAKQLVDDQTDRYWPVRRALFIRGQFRLDEADDLLIDEGLLQGILEVPRFYAGSRSLEFLCGLLKADHLSGAHRRSVLPGRELLGMHVDAAHFWEIIERDREFEVDSRKLAAGLNSTYTGDPGILITDPGVKKAWDDLIKPNAAGEPDPVGIEDRASNYAQAAGIPSLLRLAGYRCVRGYTDPAKDWQLIEELEHMRAVFAEAEHNRWMVERMLRGWRYGDVKKKAEKIHNLLVPFTHLDVGEQIKDEWLILGRRAENGIRAIPTVLERLRAIGWRVEKIPDPTSAAP